MDDLELLDSKYPDSDFIVTDIEDFDSTREWPHWVQIEGRLDKPWGHYIVCVCRISRKLLNEMDNVVKKQCKLIFKEIMFHTLAIHNNMKIDTPPEIKNITIRHYPLDYSKYQKGHFYHSIKDMDLHKIHRSALTDI